MKLNNKKARGGFGMIAFSVLAILMVLGVMGYFFSQNQNSIYKEYNSGDLKIKALNTYQFIGSTNEVDKSKEAVLEIENVNLNKDYNLKIIYESLGKNETLLVEILAGKKEIIKVPNLFTNNDVNGLNVYTKEVEIKNGVTEITSFDYKLNVGRIEIDKLNKTRAPSLVIAEDLADSIIVWYDFVDNSTLSDITGVESNNSKVTITGVSFVEDTLNSNKWARITINYDVKGSVLENKYLEDAFKIDLKILYSGTNTTTNINIVEDLVRTSTLNDYAKLQENHFELISNVN